MDPVNSWWYAIQAKPQCEFRIERELERFEIERYLPTRTRKGYRNSVVETPLLPGYVFARAASGRIYEVLRFTGWMIRIVSYDLYQPVPSPNEQIETLRLMVNQPKVEVVRLEDVWKGGENVTISSGAFAGRTGRVMMVKGKARLVVMLEALGRAVSVELEADAVKLAPEQKAA